MDKKLLDTNPNNGLSEQEVQRRLKEFGYNKVLKTKRFQGLFEFLQILLSPLIFLLFGASFISALAGDIRDFFIIIFIVLVSSAVSYFQKRKAEHEADKLKQKVAILTTVLRDGIKKDIPISTVVVGDIVLLTVGDIVPADCKIISSKNLSIDESMLTGESFPKDKLKDDIAYMATQVVAGEAKAIIDATGRQTRFAMLSSEIIKPKPPTSFDVGLKNLSVLIVKFVIVMAFIVFGVNTFLHDNLLQSLLFSLAIAVGITPEMLPVILTINLSKGAVEMEKKDVVIKYLPAIQNLGGMNILATDKTGTLTEGNITLKSYEDYKGNEDLNVLEFCFLNSYFQSGYRNPMDSSILKNKDKIKFNLSDFRLVDELPFDFERKCLSVIINAKNKNIIITKGAVHEVLDKSTFVIGTKSKTKLNDKLIKLLSKKYEELSQMGYRVIAVAKKDIADKKEYSEKDESNLEFLGFIYFFDTIKKSVKEALNKLEGNKIEIKILTGDNEFATATICNQAGLISKGLITSAQFQAMDASEKLNAVIKNTIFARLTPEQKAEIISLLKKNGQTVGYLGDGVNDAPPLKTADVGISVSNGADIALDIADVVLMKKSLAVLNAGVEDGRKTHVNIFKYLMMEISSNFGNMITVSLASFFLPFIPMLPTQILLNNFLYDMSQVAIATDNVDPNVIKTPKKWDITFIKKFMLVFGPVSSIFDFITFFILLILFKSIPSSFRTGWFIESLITQTLIIFAIRTSKIPFFKSKPSKILIWSSLLTILVGFILTLPPFGSYFAFSLLNIKFYPYLLLITISYFILVEFVKSIFYKRYHL